MVKKHLNRILIAGLGIGVLIATIVPVMVFILGSNIIINPQIDSKKSLTIPFPVSGETSPEQELLDEAIEHGIEPIENIESVTIGEVEVIANNTVTSNDAEIIQVIEQIFEPKIVKLEANIVKIDNNQKKYEEKLTFNIPLASLFVEDTSNIDFSKGFIEFNMNLIAEPN